MHRHLLLAVFLYFSSETLSHPQAPVLHAAEISAVVIFTPVNNTLTTPALNLLYNGRPASGNTYRAISKDIHDA